MKKIVFLFIVILIFIFNPLFAERVIFLHFNDEHGNYSGRTKDEKNIESMAHLAAWVETIKKRNRGARVILTFGGDMNSGSPESDELNAMPDVDLMNLIGVDVGVIGNHEFDKELNVFDSQFYKSRFPWISGNIYYNKSTPFALPYYIMHTKENKIAFIGFTTRHTEKIGNPKNMKNVQFTSPLEEYQKLSEVLKNRVDYIVILSHLGYYPEKDGKRALPREYEDEITFLNKIKENKPFLLLGGHSHTKVKTTINETYLMQSKCCLKFLSLAEFELNPGEKAKLLRMEHIALNEYPLEYYQTKSWWNEYLRKKTEHAKKITLKYNQIVDKKLGQVIASTDVTFIHNREDLFSQSIPLGNLIADSQKEMTGADVAIMNAGGIRRELSQGQINMKAVLSILPFKNDIGVVEVTGKELYDILYNEVIVNQEGGGYPQISGMIINANIEKKQLAILINGDDIDMNKKYKLAINAYLAAGGLGYPNFAEQNRFQTDGIMDYRLLAEYLKKAGKISQKDYEAKWEKSRISLIK